MEITVILKRVKPITNRVLMIKQLRSITGYGLRESKMICDRIFDEGSKECTEFTHRIGDTPEAVEQWFESVADFNLNVAEAQIISPEEVAYYLPQLEEISLAATLRGDFLVKTTIDRLIKIGKLADNKASNDA